METARAVHQQHYKAILGLLGDPWTCCGNRGVREKPNPTAVQHILLASLRSIRNQQLGSGDDGIRHGRKREVLKACGTACAPRANFRRSSTFHGQHPCVLWSGGRTVESRVMNGSGQPHVATHDAPSFLGEELYQVAGLEMQRSHIAKYTVTVNISVVLL